MIWLILAGVLAVVIGIACGFAKNLDGKKVWKWNEFVDGLGFSALFLVIFALILNFVIGWWAWTYKTTECTLVPISGHYVVQHYSTKDNNDIFYKCAGDARVDPSHIDNSYVTVYHGDTAKLVKKDATHSNSWWSFTSSAYTHYDIYLPDNNIGVTLVESPGK